ncbi:unknown [Clostridium sp. CAG:533]|nr:unknown [Clostridium sp. CAG:533]
MKIKITYPKVSPKIIKHQRLINFMKWPLLIAVIICPIINLIIGGKAWSLVVLMSIYMAWDLVISRDLVEYNRISQFVKLITLTSLLLITIDVFLAPGWALEAVPILIFSGLIVTSVLFLTDIERQKQNIFPFLFLILLSIFSSIIGLSFYHEKDSWPLTVMGIVALFLLITLSITLKENIINELKKGFSVK